MPLSKGCAHKGANAACSITIVVTPKNMSALYMIQLVQVAAAGFAADSAHIAL